MSAPVPAPAAASAPALTPVFVRLELSLLRNGLRQSGGRKAAYITSAVVALLFAALQLVGLVVLRRVDHAESLVVLLVAVLALGWAVMPLFFPSGDETLDPTRLVMLPLRPRPLVRALLIASLVGIGPLFTLCMLVGSVIAVAHGGAAFAVSALAVPLALLLITLPYATLVTVLTTAMLGDWPRLPEALGMSFALLGAMLATGAWTSACFPYSIPQEGYKNVAPGQTGLAWISIFGGMVAAAVLCAPVIALTIWLNVSAGGEGRTWLLLPVGTVYGAAIGLLGLRLAAPRTARRLPEILTAVSRG